jgi:hypothetical protein
MGEGRVLHGAFEAAVVEPVELEHEEQQMGGGRGDALLDVRIELCPRGIDGVAGMDQGGERDQPAEQVVERLVALDRRGEQAASIGRLGKRGELSPLGLLER